ncbi:hypothetical protein VC273_22370 [Xanthomonas nasturtii]|nr:hypothetical protein [Xanthomonas nasturtii]MEA9558530.1 hypothetical protein [Xanthomonas nasturtii]
MADEFDEPHRCAIARDEALSADPVARSQRWPRKITRQRIPKLLLPTTA